MGMLRGRRKRRGQALVEFALILPIFLLVLLGILDLGRAVYASSTINNAAHEAGRRAIVDQTCSSVVAVGEQHSVSLGTVAVEVTWLRSDGTSVIGSCPASAGISVTDIANVRVRYTYQAATPIISQLVGPISMVGETKFPIEATCVDPTPPIPGPDLDTSDDCPIGS